jgi:hypothetical protein
MLTKHLRDIIMRHKISSGLIVILAVTAIGTYLLVGSHAASPYTSTTADSGTPTNGAIIATNCSGASDGNCVVFQQSIAMDNNVALGLSQPGTPYAASSFWNTALPTNTPVNANNAEYLNSIAYNMCYSATAIPSTPPPACPTSTYYGALNSSAWSAPLYVVPANQPLVSVTRDCGTTNTNFNNSVAGGVPVPADAHGAAGTDQEIIIYQPSTDKEWEFWQFQKDSGGNWDACWGGGMTDVSGSDGVFPSDLGATATSLPNLGADPRVEELRAGHIDHAIGITIGDVATADLSESVMPANVPVCTNPPTTTDCAANNIYTNGVSWPATRTDGGSANPLAVPEGTRFRFPSALNLNNYNLTPVAKVIAVAAQQYGFVVDDSCPQPCMTIRIGDPTAYSTAGLPNPYTVGPGVGGVGNRGLFNGVTPGLIMKNFPWNQLQALPFNYGKPSGS